MSPIHPFHQVSDASPATPAGRFVPRGGDQEKVVTETSSYTAWLFT